MTQAGQTVRVKFVARGRGRLSNTVWTRQFPGGQPVWGDCTFLFDSDESRYDWLVVYDDLPAAGDERFSKRVEVLACPREQTLLVTTEPSSIKYYGDDFLAQFGHVLTSHEPWAVRHPSLIYSQPALRWYYGFARETERHRTFDGMLAAPEAKDAVISAVCSTKRDLHTTHFRRYDFVQRLKERMPEMDLYGLGVRFMDDKAEALDRYRYHVAIENHRALHHWTEKLADSFLGLTLPFYFGAPNAADYFPPESFVPIDIRDVDGSEKIIRGTIAAGEYEKRLPAIREARRRVMYEYNIFAVVAKIVRERHDPAAARQPRASILSRHQLRRRYPWKYLSFALRKAWVRLLARWYGAT